MNLPKQMQHHSLPMRPPTHMRHPMHQGPMHGGHPPPPPPHMAINMGPPPPQQPPHHMTSAPHGPPPQGFGMPQMRDQNRLAHHQLPQQHPQQRLSNPMQQNQMQHLKGRPHVAGGRQQEQMKNAGMQKGGQQQVMRNNGQQSQKAQQSQALRHQPPQSLGLIGATPQPLSLLKASAMPPLQPQLQQQQQQQLVQQQKPNMMQQGPAAHNQPLSLLSRQLPQQRNMQSHNNNHRTPTRQNQTQNRQQQKFSNPRSILQNPNRNQHNNNNNQRKANGSAITPLPTVSEVESAVIKTIPKNGIVDKLSPVAEDPDSQGNPKKSDAKSDEENALLNDFLSVVMKDDACFSNSKEKTPMCLVNELARFNKIQHQYRLTSENGPAHCKRFTVTLKLGEEEYSAEGFKIKKAQHTAAAEAIKATKYKHPLPKAIRRPDESLRATITPTVELNALAMKLGQQTYYVFDPRSQQDPAGHNQRMQQNNMGYPSGSSQQQQRFGQGRAFGSKFPCRIPSVNGQTGMPPANGALPEVCKITLIVGKQRFVGMGRTLQAAKHDAAANALQVLKTQAANKFKELITRTTDEGEWKSPISLVHEIAIKRNLTVNFKVLREEGPAHMKNFITTCEVGNIVTEGDGNGKKISKKRAAEKMLEELKKLPPPSPTKSPPMKRIKVKGFKRKPSPTPKKKGGNSIRDKTASECAEDANPISRLIHIQQSRNEKEPSYELVSRSGESKKREFIMEVNVPGKVARGTGSSKKLAKRSAAQNLLIAMGVDVDESGNEENNSKIANQNTESKAARKVEFPEKNNSNQPPEAAGSPNGNGGGPSGRQIVPGVLLLRQHSKDSDEAEASSEAETATTDPPKPPPAVALPMIECGGAVRPKDQLMYLAQILGFQANFSDYPKGNHSEFLTIVTLSTAPPQICHGVGLNVEDSQDEAASAALQILSKLGLDNIKSKTDET